jgi:hypothetical protein
MREKITVMIVAYRIKDIIKIKIKIIYQKLKNK